MRWTRLKTRAIAFWAIFAWFDAYCADTEYLKRLSIPEIFEAGGIEETEGAARGRIAVANELLCRDSSAVFDEALKRLTEPEPQLLTHAFSIFAIDQCCRERMKELPPGVLQTLDVRGKHQWLVHVWQYPSPAYKAQMLEVLRAPGAWQSERELLNPLGALSTPLIVAADYFHRHASSDAAPLLQTALDSLPEDAQKRSASIPPGFPYLALAADLSHGDLTGTLFRSAAALGRCEAAQSLAPFRFSLLELDHLPNPAPNPTPAEIDGWIADLEHAENPDRPAQQLLLHAARCMPALWRASQANPAGAFRERLRVVHDFAPVVATRRSILNPRLYTVPMADLPAHDALHDLCTRVGIACDSLEHLKPRVLYGGQDVPAIALILGFCNQQPPLCYEPLAQAISDARAARLPSNLRNTTTHVQQGVGIVWGIHGEFDHFFRAYAFSRFWNVFYSGNFSADAYVLPNGSELSGCIFNETRFVQRSNVAVNHAVDRVRKASGRASPRGQLRVWLPVRAETRYLEVNAEVRFAMGEFRATLNKNGASWHASTNWQLPFAATVRSFDPVVRFIDRAGSAVALPTSNRPVYQVGDGLYYYGDAFGSGPEPARACLIYFTLAEERWIPTQLPERKILEEK